ncbi:MAG: glycosyltransferase involved in cell wall biosynthesis [Halioglobus sp.]|jgi:glycosyltransferase involved in cell wall biosynthesis
MEGVSRYIYETTKVLSQRKEVDKLYLFFDRKFDTKFIFSKKVIPIVIPPQARHPILWDIWFEVALPYYLKKYKIDAFYSGDTYLSLKTAVPTLLVSHDIAYAHYPDHIKKIHLKYYKKNFPKFHKKADHIVAVSEFTRRDIIKTYDLNPDKVSVGYNACPSGFIPLQDNEKQNIRNLISNGKHYFIYVGSLHPRKNVVTLIKAFDQFKKQYNSEEKLVLIGRMAWKNEELKNISNSISCKGDIIFMGQVSHDDLPKYVASSTALTYVSLFEGFGIPILEAMSCDTPVITSDKSSMPEVGGNAAYYVNPDEIESIVQAMHDVSTDENLRKSMIQKGQKRVNRFSWIDTGNHIFDMLKKIAK